MNHNKQISRKGIPHSATPKNININQNSRIINYNTSYSNNNKKHFQSSKININSFLKKNFSNSNILKDSDYTSQNSSDINIISGPSSLKDQILSPGDDDLYYNNKNPNNQNNKDNNICYNNNQNKNVHNINAYNNKQNNNNGFDCNYYLNFDINNKYFKSIDDNNKKTLILDLDETLVHSSFHPFIFNNETIQPDIFFTILFENKTHDVYVLKRPYIKEFLNKMSKLFNIYVFTASIKEYAYPLLLKLDKHKLFKKKLFRENCTLSEDNRYIKDLNILNENLKNVILLDNNPNSYKYNKCNGIPIKTWHYDKNDNELIKMIPFLTFLSMVDDVRKYIPQVVEGDQVNYYKINNIINSNNLNLNDFAKKENIDNKNKKLINKIKNQKTQDNDNINNNYLTHTSKIKIYTYYTNEEESKININKCVNQNRKKLNLSINKSKPDKYLDIDENNNFYRTKINFNKFEERKNNFTTNYNTLLNEKKKFHSPATINFQEPINHFNSGIFSGYKSKIGFKNNMILSSGNVNINKTNENKVNRYQRSKSLNNFNELGGTFKKFSSINFNSINSHSNPKTVKNSVDSKNIQRINSHNNINNSKVINNNNTKMGQNKNMTMNFLTYNNNNKINKENHSKLENSLSLQNNNNILTTYAHNNHSNINITDVNSKQNIMTINLKDESSNINIYKQIKENKTQRKDNNYDFKLLNGQCKPIKKPNKNQNLFRRSKNRLLKKRITENEISSHLNEQKHDNNKNKEKNNENNIFFNKNKKNNDLKNKVNKRIENKSEQRKNISNYNIKNNSLSKTNGYNNKLNNFMNNYNDKNNGININNYKKNADNFHIENKLNNDNEKIRSSTFNQHHNSNYKRIILNYNFEENKNSNIEIPKNIKKKISNNLKDNKNYINDNNLKSNIHNYIYNNNINRNLNINYNTTKLNNYSNINHLTNFKYEKDMLNIFMDEINKKDQKEISCLLNYKNIRRGINSQRISKMTNQRKNKSTQINFNYNNDYFMTQKINKNEKEKIKDKKNTKKEIFNKQNDDYYYDNENFYSNFYQKKNKPYIISKETNNFIKKKMKNINVDEDFSSNINDIKIWNKTTEDEGIKNIKFISLKKDENILRNTKLFQKMNKNENIISNNRIKFDYSFAGKK